MPASDVAPRARHVRERSTMLAEGSAPAPLYDLIELMFFAYRDFVGEADRILAHDDLGRAHHRVLHFAVRRPGLTVAELLEILRITKQSLNRVLGDLRRRGFITTRSGERDRRQRRLFATETGKALIERTATAQTARLRRALDALGPGTDHQAIAFLTAMTDGPSGPAGWDARADDGPPAADFP